MARYLPRQTCNPVCERSSPRSQRERRLDRMEAESKRAEISEPLLPPAVRHEPLLPPPMSQGYKSTTDHEEDEDDSDYNSGRPGKDYRPPKASKSRSGSMSRLPPRAANPTLDFGTARRPSASQLETHKARQHLSKQPRRQSSNGVAGSPRHKPAAWPLRASLTEDPESASRCTSYCCAHTLELVGVDLYLPISPTYLPISPLHLARCSACCSYLPHLPYISLYLP